MSHPHDSVRLAELRRSSRRLADSSSNVVGTFQCADCRTEPSADCATVVGPVLLSFVVPIDDANADADERPVRAADGLSVGSANVVPIGQTFRTADIRAERSPDGLPFTLSFYCDAHGNPDDIFGPAAFSLGLADAAADAASITAAVAASKLPADDARPVQRAVAATIHRAVAATIIVADRRRRRFRPRRGTPCFGDR